MGGLVSRRKKGKIEARSVSTQATEKRKAGTNELQVECRADVATDETLIIQAAVKELKIGDGHSPDPEYQNHESAIAIRASNENKKRRGLCNVKPERPKSTNKLRATTPGVDFSTQYDFLGIPGQVSPVYRSPVKEAIQKHKAKYPDREMGDDPDESVNFGDIVLPSPRKGSKKLKISSRRSPRKAPATDTRETDDGAAQQDENSNIVKEGTLLAELRNRELFGGCPDDELAPTIQRIYTQQHRPTPPGLTQPAGDVTASPAGDRSPKRQRKKTVTYREDCKPAAAAAAEPPRFGLNEVITEFRLSLEQICQNNVPYDLETLEVAAVTGTGSARQTLPPPGGYNACWNEAVPLKDGSTGTEPIENGYDPLIDYMDADPGDVLEEDPTVVADEDIEEDTLDVNNDDRVRSPSDSRTDSNDLSDDQEDGSVDLLGDCSIDVVPPGEGVRQNSLTTLKDGDSAGGSIHSPTAHPSPSPNKPPRVFGTAQVQSGPGEARKTATAPAVADTKAKTSGPGEDKGTNDKTDKLLMTIDKKTADGQQKSLLEMQEAEAMTLLLLTGTLPGEGGGGVIRGAGDAKNLDPATGAHVSDEKKEADERAGLAVMQSTQSKTSCQLEQLQLEVNEAEVNNVVLNDALLPIQRTQVPADSSSAAGAQTAPQPRDGLPTRGDVATEGHDGATGTRRNQVQDDARNGGAAACLPHEGTREVVCLPPRVISPGAASPGDWEVIPLRRVPAQTDLGASAASACVEREVMAEAPVQQRALGAETTQQGEQATTNAGPTADPTSLLQPPPTAQHHEERNADAAPKEKEGAAEVSVGAGDSPRQKTAATASRDQATAEKPDNKNKNTNNAKCPSGKQRPITISDAKRRSNSRKKRKSGGLGCIGSSKD